MNVHSQQTQADKRDAILEAALGEFVDRGFDGTSVPRIARAAGVATGTIYRYFDGKEMLVNEVYRRWKRRLMAALMDDFPAAAPPREQFHQFWVRLADFARAHPDAIAFLELHHHAPYLDHHSRELELRSLSPIHRLACAAQAAGVFKPTDAAALMAMVWGAFVGLLKANRLGHLELSDDVLEGIEQCIWDAVRLPQGETP